MRKVDKNKFYASVGPLNVVFERISEWPYTFLWKMRGTGKVIGKTTTNPIMGGPKEYFLS